MTFQQKESIKLTQRDEEVAHRTKDINKIMSEFPGNIVVGLNRAKQTLTIPLDNEVYGFHDSAKDSVACKSCKNSLYVLFVLIDFIIHRTLRSLRMKGCDIVSEKCAAPIQLIQFV